MKRELITTADGSHSVSVPEIGVTYHSIHGAIHESMHVFIGAGFNGIDNKQCPGGLRIFEMGLGTGLNALLTLIEAEKINAEIYYEAVELYPLDEQRLIELNYCEQLNRPDLRGFFQKFHSCEWDREIVISPYFKFRKLQTDLVGYRTVQPFNLIYFDAFAPAAQPGLWAKQVFEQMYAMLKPGGILVTYCSKGDVRRAMLAAGFSVEKLPGPPRKRQMIRAIRTSL